MESVISMLCDKCRQHGYNYSDTYIGGSVYFGSIVNQCFNRSEMIVFNSKQKRCSYALFEEIS